jgi:hypothetical protein
VDDKNIIASNTGVGMTVQAGHMFRPILLLSKRHCCHSLSGKR